MLVFVTACKKTVPDSPKEEILTTGSWKMTSYTSYTMTGSTDVYASYDACLKDNTYHFNKNGTLDIDEGASKCDVYDPQSYSVRWGFSNDRQTQIKIDGTDYVISITDNEFELSTCFYSGCGADFIKITYRR
jgi:hypothetical protein